MWYYKEEPITNFEYFLDDVARSNVGYFDPTDLIDNCYAPREFFGCWFKASEIIERLNPSLFASLFESNIEYWIEDTLYSIERAEPSNGAKLSDTLDFYNFIEFDEVIWYD